MRPQTTANGPGSLQGAILATLSGGATPSGGGSPDTLAREQTLDLRRAQPRPAADGDLASLEAQERELEASLGLRPGQAAGEGAREAESPGLDDALLKTLPESVQQHSRSSAATSRQLSGQTTPQAGTSRAPARSARTEEPAYTEVSVDASGQYTTRTVTAKADPAGDDAEELRHLRSPESPAAPGVGGTPERYPGGPYSAHKASAWAGDAGEPATGYVSAHKPGQGRYGGAALDESGAGDGDRHWDEFLAAQGLRESGAAAAGRGTGASALEELADSNWGEEMYNAWKEKTKKRDREHEEKRREAVREEMQQCTFSPRVNRKSVAMAERTGGTYPSSQKWVDQSPLRPAPARTGHHSPRKGGTSLSVDVSMHSTGVMRLVDRFAGIGPPAPASARSHGSGPGADVSTRACLRLYQNAEGRNARLAEKKRRQEAEIDEMIAQDASRVLLLNKSKAVAQQVPSRWRQQRAASPGRPGPDGPQFRPNTADSRRSYQMVKRMEARENSVENMSSALNGAMFSQAEGGARRGAALRASAEPFDPTGARSARGAAEPAAESGFGMNAAKLDQFLARQQALLERKAGTARRLAEQEQAVRQSFSNVMSNGSKRILSRQGGRPAGVASPGRGRPASAGPQYRRPAADEPEFRPKINRASARMVPDLTRRERIERLYIDAEIRSEKSKVKRAEAEEERRKKLPFRPALHKDPLRESVQGQLRVLEGPTAYLDRTTMKMAHKEFERQRILRQRELAELEQCTFMPATTQVPEYILRIAHSRHARHADGVPREGEEGYAASASWL